MKRIALGIFGLFVFQQAFAQVSLSGNRLSKDGQTYKFSQYKEVFTRPEAQAVFQKSRTNNTMAQVFSYSGGFLVGFGLVPALKGKKQEIRNGIVYENQPNKGWTLVGIGAGLIGVGIPFAVGASKNAKKAIEIENGETATAFKPHFKLESAGTGLSLSYNF